MDDLKRHPMYQDLDWEALVAKSVEASWVPTGPSPHPEPEGISGAGDVYKGDQVGLVCVMNAIVFYC